MKKGLCGPELDQVVLEQCGKDTELSCCEEVEKKKATNDSRDTGHHATNNKRM